MMRQVLLKCGSELLIIITTIMDARSPHFLHPEQPQSMLANATIAEEIFRQSLNTSYIGQMSGQKDVPHIEKEPLFSIPQEPAHTHPKRKRIDFSSFKGQARSELVETVISDEDMHYMFIRSMNRDGKELFSETGCSTSCQASDRAKCRLQLLNESSIQIYTLGDKGFDQLFASINFDTLTAEIHFDSIPQNRQIAVVIGGWKLVVQHQKRKVVEHWEEQILKMQAQSKGKEIKLTKLLANEQFYRERFETEDFFAKNCQTGDVILFQDDHFFAKAQRFFTRSNFDHVGMVVKDTKYGLLIFESNSGSGVGLTPWRSVIRYGWYRSIPKISWRRLKVQRDKHFNQTVQKFVMENLRKNYHISLAKITAHQSVIRPAGNANKNNSTDENDESGFFCSELVATVYKQLGLLTRDTSSDNYQPACKFYPKDFSQLSGRKLDKGELSPEYTVYFDPALLKLTYKGVIKQQ